MIFLSFIQTDLIKKQNMGLSVINTLIGLNTHTLFNTLPLWHACHSFIL